MNYTNNYNNRKNKKEPKNRQVDAFKEVVKVLKDFSCINTANSHKHSPQMPQHHLHSINTQIHAQL